ncbi:unnamed protein product [Ixodes persulcatus]
MVIKVYVSGISASKEVKKKQQRALMILQSIKVPFKSVDITEPGQEEARDFMREHCKKTDAGGCTPPPHFFSGNDYLGDYDDFDQATEEDKLITFLKLDPAEYNLNGSNVVPEGLEPIAATGDKGEDTVPSVANDAEATDDTVETKDAEGTGEGDEAREDEEKMESEKEEADEKEKEDAKEDEAEEEKKGEKGDEEMDGEEAAKLASDEEAVKGGSDEEIVKEADDDEETGRKEAAEDEEDKEE